MPASSDIARGNLLFDSVLALTLNVPAVSANASISQTYNVAGLMPLDFIEINRLQTQANVVVANAFCGSPGVLTIEFGNVGTGAAGAANNVPFLVSVARPSNAVLGSAQLPSQIT